MTIPHHMLMYVLSVSNPSHDAYRCYHRASLQAFGMQHGFLRVDELRTLRHYYVVHRDDTDIVERRRSLDAEARHHQDLLQLPESSTCLGKVIKCLQHAKTEKYDSVLFSDDDAWIHPYRFVLDVAEHAAPNLVYGQMTWGAGWDATRQVHFGYANTPIQVTGTLLELWKKSGHAQGPFPFPYGFLMGLGRDVVTALNEAMISLPQLSQLSDYLRHKPATKKCAPEPDAGMGYLLAQLQLPLRWVDVSSSARVHFRRTRTTERALGSSLSIMHGAKDWETHFRFAACTIAKLPSTNKELSRGTRCEQANVAIQRACGGGEVCTTALGRYWEPNVTTWCHTDLGKTRRRSSTLRLDSSVCNASAPTCSN